MPGDATRARRTRHPGTKAPASRWDAFISHLSRDDSLAARLEKRLQATGVSVWIDHTNLRRRGLLLSALQDAMSHCANVVLLWSKPAAESRYGPPSGTSPGTGNFRFSPAWLTTPSFLWASRAPSTATSALISTRACPSSPRRSAGRPRCVRLRRCVLPNHRLPRTAPRP